MGSVNRKQPELFDTPFELGLRMVYLLFALRPNGADLQKLVLLDYAIVYSHDVGGPDRGGLHGARTPEVHPAV